MNNLPEKSATSSQILLYKTDDGHSRIEVRLENETVWLSQKLMAELFQVTVPTINEHVKNIFKDRELQQNSVIRKFRITAADGKSYLTNFYNIESDPIEVSSSVSGPLNGFVSTSSRGSHWTMSVSRNPEVLIISTNCSNESVPFGPRKNVFTKRFVTSMPPVSIMTPPIPCPGSFSQPFKTNCILQLRAILLPN